MAEVRALVLTVSEAALADPAEDRAAPILAEALSAVGLVVERSLVGPQDAAAALERSVAGHDLVVTCGGSGMRPGDQLPELTRALPGFVEVPGVMEEVRRRGAQKAPASLLSRGLAGVLETTGHRCFVLNAPSSRGGARDVAAVLADLLPDLLRDLSGGSRL